MICCGLSSVDSPLEFKLTSMVQGQSYNCPPGSDAILKNMDKYITCMQPLGADTILPTTTTTIVTSFYGIYRLGLQYESCLTLQHIGYTGICWHESRALYRIACGVIIGFHGNRFRVYDLHLPVHRDMKHNEPVLRPWYISSNGNILRVTGHLCGEFTGQRWIPRIKASDAELWCFLWSASE